VHKGDQLSGGVALLGLGLLFLTGWWWPGLLFLGGAISLAQTIESGRRWYAAQGALWMFGLGLVFAMGFSIGLLLLLVGASMLGGHQLRRRGLIPAEDEALEKRKRKLKNEERDIAYRIGDDGELIPEDEYLYDDEESDRRRHNR
jgi:hypothetical protein